MTSAKELTIVQQPERAPARRALNSLNRFAFEPDSWETAIGVAETLCRSGLLPQEVRSPQAAVAIIMFGREFGFTVWQSFRLVTVIKGKPGLNAQGMAAVILASGKAKFFKCTEVTYERATWKTHRIGDDEPQHFTYTMADAQKAKLTNSEMYSKYPRQMLRWRACTELARQAYSDVVGGILTPDDFGEVIDADFSESPEDAPALPPPADVIDVPPPADTVEPPPPADPLPASKTAALKAQIKKQQDTAEAEKIRVELAEIKAELVTLIGEDQAGWLWSREVQTTRTLRERRVKAHEIISREIEKAEAATKARSQGDEPPPIEEQLDAFEEPGSRG